MRGVGKFIYDDPCDRPYGPTNPDYEYDAKVARDMNIEQDDNIFAAAADAQRIAIKLGRQQIALEIIRVLESEKNDVRAIARVLNICVRESK